MNRHIQLTRYLNHAHPQYTWRFERTLNFIINCSNNTFLSAFVYLQCFTLNRWLRKRTRQNAKQPPSNMKLQTLWPNLLIIQLNIPRYDIVRAVRFHKSNLCIFSPFSALGERDLVLLYDHV